MKNARRTKSASDLASFRIRLISEPEIEAVIVGAGGTRAHPDADKRTLRGADFLLGDAVIELKILEDEGLDKPERQQKLARLFGSLEPGRPTVVLDRNALDDQAKREYDRIVEGPVKTAVASARRQLKQSQVELSTRCGVLWVINNGYTSLSHDSLLELVARRAKNDSTEIDAVVVSGAYSYGDGFDSFFLWPMEVVDINPDRLFHASEALHQAWEQLSVDSMNELMRKPEEAVNSKGPVVDISFEVDEVTFVMPTPPMGGDSIFFTRGRPRSNSTGGDSVPHVATIFAGLSPGEWSLFREHQEFDSSSEDFSDWKRDEESARTENAKGKFLTIPILYDDWVEWMRVQPEEANLSVHAYAAEVFNVKIGRLLEGARERTVSTVLPRRYMLLLTQEIGQDLAFDVSDLAEVFTRPDGQDAIEEVWTDRRIFFTDALAVAGAEAIGRGVEHIFWQKDQRYLWR
jgi:hypothetical protein